MEAPSGCSSALPSWSFSPFCLLFSLLVLNEIGMVLDGVGRRVRGCFGVAFCYKMFIQNDLSETSLVVQG